MKEKKKEYLEKSMDAINKTLEGLKYSEVMDIKLDIALSLPFLRLLQPVNMLGQPLCWALFFSSVVLMMWV